MTKTRVMTGSCVVASLMLCAVIACTVTVDPGEGTITISNKVFKLTLGNSGVFDLQLGSEPVAKAIKVEDLFVGETPRDTPESAVVSLDPAEVTVVPLGTLKAGPTAQTISGSAMLNIYIDTADTPCETGIFLGTINLTFDDSGVSIGQGELTIPAQALVWLLSGEFTLCLEMTATVDVRISIEGINIEFGPPGDPPPDGNVNDNGSEGCTTDADCGTDHVCVGGVCGPEICVSDADCAAGETCENGACSPMSGACTSDADCTAGETCDGGICVVTPDGCTSDADCAAGETCDGGTCAPPAAECATDGDCGADELCLAGVCISAPSGCAADSDCTADETCVSGVCVPASITCTTDDDCAAGESCLVGVCLVSSGACTTGADCTADELCLGGLCIALPTGCTVDTDCDVDETCVGGTCVAGPLFSTATILHRGAEQIIAGPDVDSSVSAVTPEGYGVGGYKRVALSGDDSAVWFALYDEFPNVEGDPQTQLWRVNIDGSGGQRSMLALDDIRQGITVETDETGSVCYADNRREGRMYRATPGAAATTAFNYYTDADGYIYGDVRGEFKINDAATTMVYASFVDTRYMSVDLTASPNVPVAMGTNISLAYLGVNARNMWFNIDFAGDGSRWAGAVEHWSGDWDPNSQAILRVGSSTAAGAVPAVQAVLTDLQVGASVNITDDGLTIGHCRVSGTAGINDPNECLVEAVDGSSSVSVGDRRTSVSNFLLSDDGSRVYYRTDACCSGGTGIFENVATDERLPVGSRLFAMGWTDMRLSDDGNTLIGPSPYGVYVLHDGVGPPTNFPTIDDLSFRLATTGEECSMFIRVTASSPRGIETIFANPYRDGVDPTEFVPGEENPMFAGRTGFFTAFSPVEGLTNVWEKEIRLTNSVGACVSDLLTTDYRLRVVVQDLNGVMTVFQDFAPAQ